MFTTAFRDSSLGNLGGFIGLFTALSNFRAGTLTEANYTGYGTRPGVTWGAAADTSPAGGRQRANSAAVSFPTNTGSNQDAIGWFVASAATAGTIHAIGFLDDDPPILGTANDADEVITAPAHGLQADQRVFVLAAPGAVIPTGLSENTAYFVRSTGLTTDAFTVSTTSGGAAVNITAKGAAFFMPYKAVTIATGATPSFAIGQLVVQM